MKRKRVNIVAPHPGTEFLAGIARHIRLRRDWRVDFLNLSVGPFDPVHRWPHDGIIAQLFMDELGRSILESGKPVVNFSDSHDDWPFPSVHSDNHAIGALGAEHLLERGFRQLGYVLHPGSRYAEDRGEGFAAAAARAGARCETLLLEPQETAGRTVGVRRILEWLTDLPRPMGIGACHDGLARYTVEACLDNGIAVPEEVAVVGVDNSVGTCELVEVPISSVIPDATRIAYECAQLLDQLLRGEAVPNGARLVPPVGVAVRQSTDIVAVGDAEVARAVRYVREHLRDQDVLGGLLEDTARSRRWLERRFRDALGRSIMDEVIRVRLAKARELLRETDLPMPAIAAAAGFTDLNHLGRSFRRVLGINPTAYRAQYRIT